MSNQNDLFKITLPDTWKDRTVHTFMGPEDSGVQHNMTLVIDKEDEYFDLQGYAAERRDQILETLQGVDILKDEQKSLANGTVAWELVYKWIPVEGTVIFQKMLFVLVDNAIYTFSGNFSKKTIKTIGVEFEKIVETFTPMKI
ncbi:hypothetical protein TRIP_C20977 [Candidatus Zixiibacteriota bacterium]|nr:hypothetical protein TRIP_C20977 [candidate division Zixibacteria bacterium]